MLMVNGTHYSTVRRISVDRTHDLTNLQTERRLITALNQAVELVRYDCLASYPLLTESQPSMFCRWSCLCLPRPARQR